MSQYLPLAFVFIDSQEWDSYEARYYGGPGASTDENGYFEMGCPAEGNMLERTPYRVATASEYSRSSALVPSESV